MSLNNRDEVEFWNQGTHEYLKGVIASIEYMDGYFWYATIKYSANRKRKEVNIYREDWINVTKKASSSL